MDAERWQKIEQLCQAALECEPSERAAFLQQACAGDEELRRQVEALLAREKQAENFCSPVPPGWRDLQRWRWRPRGWLKT
jgi:hypothetical protein